MPFVQASLKIIGLLSLGTRVTVLFHEVVVEIRSCVS